MTHPPRPPLRVLICGGGLAAEMVHAALASGLGTACEVMRVAHDGAPRHDALFGGVTSPSAYDFFRSIGLSEPRLFLNAPTTFSYGTRFADWPAAGRSWYQTYYAPLEPLSGIPFHQFVSARNDSLEPYLVNAAAARYGRFAHPPADNRHPLAKTEYGYHFSAEDLVGLLREDRAASTESQYDAPVVRVISEAGHITAVELQDGQRLSADLYIDCSGPDRTLIGSMQATFRPGARLRAASGTERPTGPCAPVRSLRARPTGWEAEIPLHDRVSRIHVWGADDAAQSGLGGEALEFETGRLDQAWLGNCIAIGHAAAVFQPLSPAPVMVLERAVKRLLELAPTSADMSVEAREFNRRFADDADHASMFHRSLFQHNDFPPTPFWRMMRDLPVPDALGRKLRQFESRGLLIQYDNELFHPEDWAIQHFGMGRRPHRVDPQIGTIPQDQIDRTLSEMKAAAEKVAQSMPPHDAYVAKFREYLMRNHRA